MAQILKQLATESWIYIKFLIQALKGDSEETLAAIDIIFISLVSLIILLIFLLVTSYIFGLFRIAVKSDFKRSLSDISKSKDMEDNPFHMGFYPVSVLLLLSMIYWLLPNPSDGSKIFTWLVLPFFYMFFVGIFLSLIYVVTESIKYFYDYLDKYDFPNNYPKSTWFFIWVLGALIVNFIYF